MELIQKHIKNLKLLCNKFHVAELYVFGSILTANFNKKSDIDFLVQFSDVDAREYFDNYMDFKENLEKLLSRNIDLVEVQTLKNPVLKESVENNKILIYERKDSKMAV